jgi:transcriptional regulator with PAS, ATPase and Fis domain
VTFKNALLIGRKAATKSERDLQSLALSDRLISSQHASIAPAGAGYELTDLGSTNGTIVDGVPVQGTVKLRDGSLVFLGGYAAVFRVLSMSEVEAITAELYEPFGPVPTVNPPLALLCAKLRKLAESGQEILLTGETGVGKEVYANAIHRASGRAGRFVAVNCAAIPRELVESELFGYLRGAHSQASASKPGIIEAAEGGTLFLDEIGEMPAELQTKLLRFTQDRLLAPVGGSRSKRIDTRILAATSRTTAPLEGTPGGLRADLAARLGAEPIRIPPLRERPEDLGTLIQHLSGARPRPLDLLAFQALCLYQWPGNVRELGKVVAFAQALAGNVERITFEHLPATLAGRSGWMRASVRRRGARPPPTPTELEELMRRFSGNMLRVSRELDRKPALVYRWAKKFRLDANAFRK